MFIHTCNPSTQEMVVGEVILGYIARLRSSLGYMRLCFEKIRKNARLGNDLETQPVANLGGAQMPWEPQLLHFAGQREEQLS